MVRVADRGPLSDIVVIDLTRVLAGPFCTLLLSDLGARVIKVENPEGGDDSRHYGPFINGKSGYFISQNRGKESIALDLKSAADIAILHRLLKGADVVIENFRPGTMQRLGLDWEALHPRYPKLIYASTSGFGQTGPYAKRAAYDIIAQAMGGIMSVTGHEGGPPTRVGSSIGDLGAGMFTALGILTAMHHRTKTGEGMMIDVAMLDSQVALLENSIARYFASGKPPKPLGARHPSIAPFEPYATKDGYVVIACGNDELFLKTLPHARLSRRGAGPAILEEQRAERPCRAAQSDPGGSAGAPSDPALARPAAAAGIPCAPINDVEQAVHNPQVQARNMVLPVDDPSVAPLMVAGMPIKMSAYPDAERRPAAPTLDGDRTRILADFP